MWHIKMSISWVNSIMLNLVATLKGMRNHFFKILFWPTFSWFSFFRIQVLGMLFRQLQWKLDSNLRRLVVHNTSRKDLKFNEKLETISTSCYHFTLNKDTKSNDGSNDGPWDLLSNYILLVLLVFIFLKKFQHYSSYTFFNEPNPFWANFQHFIIVLHIK